MYFNNFPTIDYSFLSGLRNVNLVDIFRSVKFSKKTLNSVEIFDTYIVSDGDTPERVADQVYGDVRLYWLVLLSNDIIDVNSEWPRFSETENDTFTTNYSGYSLYFNEYMDIKKGDYVAKRDASATAGVSNEFGVVNHYDPDLNKLEIVNHNFSTLTTGSTTQGASLDSFYVFREVTKNSFETLTTNLNSSGNDYHQPQRIDTLANSVVYFKDAGRIISPLTEWTSASYSPTGNILHSTNGKVNGKRTIARKYLEGRESDLADDGIVTVTYTDELPENVNPSRQIQVLRPEFVTDVVNEITKLVNNTASDGSRSVLNYSESKYGA